MGLVKVVQATVHVSEKAVPKLCKARAVAYALRDAVELEEQGVITHIEYSESAQENRTSQNMWVEVDQYPLPKTQDLFAEAVYRTRSYPGLPAGRDRGRVQKVSHHKHTEGPLSGQQLTLWSVQCTSWTRSYKVSQHSLFFR